MWRREGDAAALRASGGLSAGWTGLEGSWEGGDQKCDWLPIGCELRSDQDFWTIIPDRGINGGSRTQRMNGCMRDDNTKPYCSELAQYEENMHPGPTPDLGVWGTPEPHTPIVLHNATNLW